MSDVQRPGLSGADSGAIPADWQPQIVALVCIWCSYAGADLAGTTRLQYPASVRMVRFPCTGRMSPLMILKTFELGADGVLVSGCHPGDCHYVEGNLYARRRFAVFRSLMEFVGLDLDRMHFAWVSASEGHKWAEVVEKVTSAVRKAGPLPRWGEDEAEMPFELPELEAVDRPELDREEREALVGHLRGVAAELLSNGEAAMVVGYTPASLPGSMVPTMVRSSTEAERLDFSDRCLTNLAAYLPALGDTEEKIAVVVRRCDIEAVTGLLREGQVERDQLLLVGVRCPGARENGGWAAKCHACSGAVHPMCEVAIDSEGVRRPQPGHAEASAEAADPRDQQLAFLESLPAAQRWRFWQDQFRRCLRCYACRAVCPLCYCESCISEKHRPQWVNTAIDERGNTAWNLIRAFHLAGRCTGCDECARVCPADIRLDLINHKLAREVTARFGGALDDPEARAALTEFRMEDGEGFIL
jgi:coenzyme F420-reducing hydrogenase delta subunit/ferredoxin